MDNQTFSPTPTYLKNLMSVKEIQLGGGGGLFASSDKLILNVGSGRDK